MLTAYDRDDRVASLAQALQAEKITIEDARHETAVLARELGVCWRNSSGRVVKLLESWEGGLSPYAMEFIRRMKADGVNKPLHHEGGEQDGH